MSSLSLRSLASRALANLLAVAAISAIFGLKAYIDGLAPPEAQRPGATFANIGAYEPGAP